MRPTVHFETAESATVLELEDEPEAEPLQLSYPNTRTALQPLLWRLYGQKLA